MLPIKICALHSLYSLYLTLQTNPRVNDETKDKKNNPLKLKQV
jgi:hypothetical protein